MALLRVCLPILPSLILAAFSGAAQNADRTIDPARTFDLAAVNNPNQPSLAPGARGPGVVRAQILLARARFSSGEIDGVYGRNMARALAAFRSGRNLAAGDIVDQAVWTELNSDSGPALVPYNVTEDDTRGPFLEIPKEMSDQAKLPSLTYSSALEALAERFHVSPELLKQMNPGADFGRPSQPLAVPNISGPLQGAAARVVVSKSESAIRAYDAAGKLIAFYVATIGSERDPLPIGTWKILGVRRNPEFHYNPDLFWDAKSDDKKALIQPGPNNPVGVVWIDLSKEHYGLHGTPEPAKVGHASSHGCIRLTNWDAMELASLVKPGTPAELKE